ncbi:MAG: hypothetical protein K0Q43_2955 [Ramlibacter sp.]|nr:hypothetical protein [Ramlibacter sp.]
MPTSSYRSARFLPFRSTTAFAPSKVARLAMVPRARRLVAPAAASTSTGKGFCSGALRYSTLPVRPLAVNRSFCHVPFAVKLKGISVVTAVVGVPEFGRVKGPSMAKSVRMSAPCSVATKRALPRSTMSAPNSGMLRGSPESRPSAQLRRPSASICSPSCGCRNSTRGSTTWRLSSGSSSMSICAPSALTRCGSSAHSGLANSMPSAMMRTVRPSLTSSLRVISKCRPVLSLT